MAILRNVGFAMAALGLLAAVAAATADYTGLDFTQDASGNASFGWLQLAIVVIGVLALITGTVLASRSKDDLVVVFED